MQKAGDRAESFGPCIEVSKSQPALILMWDACLPIVGLLVSHSTKSFAVNRLVGRMGQCSDGTVGEFFPNSCRFWMLLLESRISTSR